MALVAHMLGARVIEKHFTLNHSWKGTDHAFSLMPEGMRKLVRDLQRIPVAIGDGVKRPLPSEVKPLVEDGEEARRGARPPGRARARARRPRREIAGGRRPAAVASSASSSGGLWSHRSWRSRPCGSTTSSRRPVTPRGMRRRSATRPEALAEATSPSCGP